MRRDSRQSRSPVRDYRDQRDILLLPRASARRTHPFRGGNIPATPADANNFTKCGSSLCFPQPSSPARLLCSPFLAKTRRLPLCDKLPPIRRALRTHAPAACRPSSRAALRVRRRSHPARICMRPPGHADPPPPITLRASFTAG